MKSLSNKLLIRRLDERFPRKNCTTKRPYAATTLSVKPGLVKPDDCSSSMFLYPQLLEHSLILNKLGLKISGAEAYGPKSPRGGQPGPVCNITIGVTRSLSYITQFGPDRRAHAKTIF